MLCLNILLKASDLVSSCFTCHWALLRLPVTLSEFVDGVIQQKFYTPISLTTADFLLCQVDNNESAAQKTQKLTESQMKRKALYESLFRDKGITVCDLQQNPQQRPRWGSDCFPTLTTGCTKIMNIEAEGRIYSQGLSKMESCWLIRWFGAGSSPWDACHRPPGIYPWNEAIVDRINLQQCTLLLRHLLHFTSLGLTKVGNSMHLACITSLAALSIVLCRPI